MAVRRVVRRAPVGVRHHAEIEFRVGIDGLRAGALVRTEMCGNKIFVYQQFLVLTESGLRVIFSSGTFNELIWVCLAILLIFSVRGLTSFVIPTISAKLSTSALFELRRDLTQHILHLRSRMILDTLKIHAADLTSPVLEAPHFTCHRAAHRANKTSVIHINRHR